MNNYILQQNLIYYQPFFINNDAKKLFFYFVLGCLNKSQKLAQTELINVMFTNFQLWPFLSPTIWYWIIRMCCFKTFLWKQKCIISINLWEAEHNIVLSHPKVKKNVITCTWYSIRDVKDAAFKKMYFYAFYNKRCRIYVYHRIFTVFASTI